MKNEKKPSEPEAKPATPPSDKKPGDPSAAEKPKPYVFKIVPADPKNAFDFEDVADK